MAISPYLMRFYPLAYDITKTCNKWPPPLCQKWNTSLYNVHKMKCKKMICNHLESMHIQILGKGNTEQDWIKTFRPNALVAFFFWGKIWRLWCIMMAFTEFILLTWRSSTTGGLDWPSATWRKECSWVSRGRKRLPRAASSTMLKSLSSSLWSLFGNLSFHTVQCNPRCKHLFMSFMAF